MNKNKVVGPGVADNSLGLAVLATLPTILERLDLELNYSLLLIGATRSLGRGNLEGLRYFLDNNQAPVAAGICVEGVQLGRLSYSSLGMLRGEIHCSVPAEYDWTRFGTTNAIVPLCDVVNKITEIPLPDNPRTRIVMGSIEGGSSFNKIATHCVLHFEIRSESAQLVENLRQSIEDIITDVSSRTRADISLSILARRRPGGMQVTHPLARCTSSIISNLGIAPRIGPSTSELSEFIGHKIPAVTIGITSGDNMRQGDESIRIQPIATGIAQIIALLCVIDKECCNAN